MQGSENLAGSSTGLLVSLMTGKSHMTHEPDPRSIRQHRLDDERPKAAVGRREFTASDKALIRQVHGYMGHGQLLGILNQRLVGDAGRGAVLYTSEQLRAEIEGLSAVKPVSESDWGALRKLIAKARRDGVLQQINEDVINDFGIVFSLNQKQVMTLKDVLLTGEGE